MTNLVNRMRNRELKIFIQLILYIPSALHKNSREEQFFHHDSGINDNERFVVIF